ncbi:response regulator [Phenylobacterium terrae]|uniref:histidine kinase n=1 Tax=Phenylobacterium terrae TaxID=2665495 RepID=A0ABW4N6P1_9CAUL
MAPTATNPPAGAAADGALGLGPAEYRFLIEANADGVVVVDAAGKVVFANPAAAEIFGRPVAQLVGAPIGVPTVAGETTEIVVLRPAGGRADVEMRVVGTAWEGRPALLASLRDISARRELEERARQSHKMEAIGRLTAGVAHDFNNLLTVVIGNLEFLQRHLGSDPEAARALRYAENAMLGARRAATLTDQLLAFSRRQPLTPQPVDINKLIAGMSDLLARTLGEAVQVESRLAADLGRAMVDANQLESAILNLAVNARDAMPDGGALILETANEAFHTEGAADLAPGPCVRITVRDTGCGMGEEVLAQAFEPFFTTKGVGHGTGLGLSQVYGFVKQSGGHVSIDSGPSRGTAVNLYLPRAAGDAAEAPAAPPDAGARADGEAILVVEDDEDVRAFSVATLCDLGYRVFEAADAAAALEVLERTPGVRLLFSDIGLPGGMNGRELADAAQARQPGLRVLLTTAYAGGTLLKDGRLETGFQLLAKPFSYAALARRVQDVLAPDRTEPQVLLVEDDALVRMTLLEALLEAGCRVEEATTASEALKKIRSAAAPLDAAVIDIGLPDGRGDALVAELRARRPGAPVVLASGYNDEDLRGRLSADEQVTFLDKPFDGAALEAALRALGVAAARGGD